ncbi:hypothetical protein [Bartonella krasnovii]|uniref:Uncharacterized protein n=1 Tax=Bartonella krasnovii TaxID=2267275 RepID=A0A5B9D2C1_9HYPH|nr:hypothetical protein [Bartonella krasnovii]QEE12703.1 hypothetical protein D1092_07015 [Bartonella krasnovii]UNF28813.1 hypothetical protein MNL13_06270 [Bartonella krasnovii]UNF35187.1 hypothetical protein MNL12_06270 [Bartonella krasnovii]UNF36809.1 hypothetical protein MNL11_06920 [Bartonella krasnovii]UNF38498.1 hypothetical protein MNL10_07120 [Bartonella krasnovii]
MTTQKPNISSTSSGQRNNPYSQWDLVLDIQKEVKETIKYGVVSLKEFILIIFISVCLYIFLSIIGNVDKDQMDATTAIGLVCVLILYGSIPVSLVLYIIIKKKLKKVIKQLDEAVANHNPLGREK